MDAPRGDLARGALLPFVRAHILFLAHRVVWLRHFVPELPLDCSSVMVLNEPEVDGSAAAPDAALGRTLTVTGKLE